MTRLVVCAALGTGARALAHEGARHEGARHEGARHEEKTGATVHRGPLVTTDHIVSGAERAGLDATGALVADMDIKEHTVTVETTEFTLPKEVRTP